MNSGLDAATRAGPEFTTSRFRIEAGRNPSRSWPAANQCEHDTVIGQLSLAFHF